MPKNKQLPEELLAKLHGKGTMSEILDIERARLLKQSEQDMRRQLGQVGQLDQYVESISSSSPPRDTGPVPLPSLPPPLPASAPASHETGVQESSPAVPSSRTAGVDTTNPIPLTAENYPSRASDIDTYQPVAGHTFHPRFTPQWPVTVPRGMEGFSAFSRVVGDDLSELGTIFRHSVETVSAAPRFSPEGAQAYYSEMVDPALPFTAQRNLLAAIRRLTLGWGTLSCQITLELLSNISGIRNFKTLRKWLADLNRRNLIRYTPVHGDLRGSVVTLTPPPEIRGEIERCWQQGTPLSREVKRTERSRQLIENK
jgi:hypothetical protein